MSPTPNLESVLTKSGNGTSLLRIVENAKIFSQGEPADGVFYLLRGKVKMGVVSEGGKEAVLGILNAGSFLGEECLAGQRYRRATASTLNKCALVRIERAALERLLREEPRFSEAFLRYLVARAIRVEEDLVDHLFNPCEKRLARVLLLMSDLGRAGKSRHIVPKPSQETLAAMVGTTRPRINQFMNKFRRLGFVEYNGRLTVNRSLLSVILREGERRATRRDPGPDSVNASGHWRSAANQAGGGELKLALLPS